MKVLIGMKKREMLKIYSRSYKMFTAKLKPGRGRGSKNYTATNVDKGEIYKLLSHHVPFVDKPPHLTVVGCYKENVIYTPPTNWTGPARKNPMMTKFCLNECYMKAQVPPPTYGICSKCGFNRVWKGVCVTCQRSSG
jgi:hypothetical protein